MLSFAVVVPTFKRKELLVKCLEGLTSQLVSPQHPFSYQICVSDDAHDADLEVFLKEKFPQVQYVKGPQRGPSANRNHGARSQQSDWIVFVDDDCIPQKELLHGYHEAIVHFPFVQAMEGKIFADRPQNRLDEESPENLKGGCFWSCNIAIRRDVFELTKGFDEDYPYAAYEDMDYLKRLVQQQIVPLFVRDAAVCHPWRRWTAWKRFIRQRKSSLIYLKKHPESASAFRAWILLKITIGHVLYNTLLGAWTFKGRGLCTALTYNFLEILFAVYRLFCQIGLKCKLR